MSTRTSRAISGTLTSFLEFGLRIGLQVALSPLVLHVAGQETLGAYAVLIQAIGYLALIDLGFGVALSRYLAQAFGYEDRRKQFGDIFTTGRTFYLFSNTAFAFLAMLFSIYVGTLFSLSASVEEQARIGLWLLAVWSIIRTPLAVYGGALIATQNLAAANLIAMVGNALRLFFSLGLVAMGMGLVGLMLANVLAEAFTFAAQRWYYHRLYPDDHFGWGIPDWGLFRNMIGFSAGYLLVIIGGRLSIGIDNLVVGKLYGAVAASIYYTTRMPTFLLVALIWKIADNAAPAVNELYGKHAIVQLRRSYLRLLRYTLLLSVSLALGLVAFNRNLIALWVGESQYAGSLMTMALALFSIAAVIDHLNGLIMVAYGAVRELSTVRIVAGVANLILSLWLGRVIGLPGVMVASALVACVSGVVLGLYGFRLLKITFIDVWREAISPALIANFFVLPVFVFAYIQQPAGTWPLLLLWSSVFMVAWVLGVVTTGLNKADIEQFRNYFGRMITIRK